MPRKNPPARWPLPDTVNPSGRKCIQVQVPDDPAHIAAFRGAMLMLSSGVNWQDDPTHKAKDVALVWRDIVDAMDWGCDSVPVVQFRHTTCVLEASVDGGVTWNEIFNAYDCGREAAQDEIEKQRDDGNIPGGSQQPGVGGGTPTVCYDWDVTLQGSGQWMFPIELNATDLVTITKVKGAWGDGPLGSLNYWYCPDGTPFILGACTGSPTHSSSDPMPDVNHMRLVGRFGDVWHDMYFGVYTLPTDVANAVLQANDSPIADNAGSIQFHVQVCKGGWCANFDFAASDGGWTADGAGSYSGAAWMTTTEAVWDECYIKRSATSFNVKHIEFKGTSSWSGDPAGRGRFGIYVKHGGTTTKVADEPAPNGNYTIVWDGTLDDVTDIWLDANVYNHSDYSGSGSATITECKMWGGTGDPFPSYNC